MRNGDVKGIVGSGNGNIRDRNKYKNNNQQNNNSNTNYSKRNVEQKPELSQNKAWNASQDLLTNPKHGDALEYLNRERGLSQEVLEKYGVGVTEANFIDAQGKWNKSKCITFPWTDSIVVDTTNGNKDKKPKAFRMKLRGLEHKGNQRLDPAGGRWGFFGWHLVPEDATSVVLCEGEFDAMAVFQATKFPAISLPNGCRSLPIDLLPKLEQFEGTYVRTF